ncbi:MAG: hypothetical protein V1690_00930 [Candidatus Moraniibacteriota bacterium]
MDEPSLPKTNVDPLAEESPEEPKKSLGDLRQQLETGQGLTPPVGDGAVIENKNHPLANPKIKTPNVGNTQPE